MKHSQLTLVSLALLSWTPCEGADNGGVPRNQAVAEPVDRGACAGLLRRRARPVRAGELATSRGQARKRPQLLLADAVS